MVTEGLLARGTAVFTGLIRCARRGAPVMSRRLLVDLVAPLTFSVYSTSRGRKVPIMAQFLLHQRAAG